MILYATGSANLCKMPAKEHGNINKRIRLLADIRYCRRDQALYLATAVQKVMATAAA